MQYLYYKLYQALRKVKTNDTPAHNAMLLICILNIMNIMTIEVFSNHFFKFKFIHISKNAIILPVGVLFFLIYIISYFSLYKKREKLLMKYKNENKFKSKMGFILLILYFVLSGFSAYYFSTAFPL